MAEGYDAVRRGGAIGAAVALVIGLLLGGLLVAWGAGRVPAIRRALHLEPQVVYVPQPPPARPPLPLARGAAPTDPALLTRIEGLEARVTRIDRSAQAASGDADRAEGLLVAFAARRALDRGRPLGYLEGLLRERFGGVEPQAVALVIGASQQPVTLPDLQTGLDRIAPDSIAGPRDGWWQGLRRELAELVVVRPAGTPSTQPVDRLARARQALDSGHVDQALAEMARMPGAPRAEGWIAAARRYVLARNALDRIETAALLAQPPTPTPTPVN